MTAVVAGSSRASSTSSSARLDRHVCTRYGHEAPWLCTYCQKLHPPQRARMETKGELSGFANPDDQAAHVPPLIQPEGAMASIAIIGSPVTALPFDVQTQRMIGWAAARERRVICVANVHMLVEAHWNPDFSQILQEADLVTPDGTPLVWMMRALGGRGQERVAGMDMLPVLCRLAAERQVPVYFLGSTPAVLERMRARLRHDFPQLIIAGMESPPFRPLTLEEDEDLVQRIEASGATLLLVSLGCPKQERWMHAHRDRLSAVMVGLGAAFPVYAGVQKMAPPWMRRSGIEWLYRLVQEPRRLFKRYLMTNLAFLGLSLYQLAKRGLSGWSSCLFPTRGQKAQ